MPRREPPELDRLPLERGAADRYPTSVGRPAVFSWSAPVDVAAVSYADDVDHETVIEDLVHDPVYPDTDPIGVLLAGDLGASRRSGVVGEEIDRGANALLFSTGQPSEGLGRPAGDFDPVAAQRRPKSALTSSHGT